MRSKTGTVRVIEAEHYLQRKTEAVPDFAGLSASWRRCRPAAGASSARSAAAAGAGATTTRRWRWRSPAHRAAGDRRPHAGRARRRCRAACRLPRSRGCATRCPTRRISATWTRAAERLADAVAAGEPIGHLRRLRRRRRDLGWRCSRATCARSAATRRDLRAGPAARGLRPQPRRRSCGSRRRAPRWSSRVDCGTTAFEALADGRSGGHRRDRRRPPRRRAAPAGGVRGGQPEPAATRTSAARPTLAAVGVAFLLVVGAQPRAARARLVRAPRPEPDLRRWLDLVALGTVARRRAARRASTARFVTQGLKVAARGAQSRPRGARRRRAASPRRSTADHLGFALGPADQCRRPGRQLATSARACCRPTTRTRRARSPRELDRLNEERRAIERQVLAAAEAQVARSARGRCAVCCRRGRGLVTRA